jgi:hypothetical protein
MKRLKVSIRGLMVLVLLCAIALALGIPAVEVYSTKDYHTHTAIDVRGTPALAGLGGVQSPFWPRYARRIVGRPWRKQPVCGTTPGFEVELCEYAHPEIAIKIGGRAAYTFTSEQGDRLTAIKTRQAREKPEPTDAASPLRIKPTE